jgi:hypothetical protein
LIFIAQNAPEDKKIEEGEATLEGAFVAFTTLPLWINISFDTLILEITKNGPYSAPSARRPP